MDIQAEIRKIAQELDRDPLGIRDKPSEDQLLYTLETSFHAIIRSRGCSMEQALSELRKMYGL